MGNFNIFPKETKILLDSYNSESKQKTMQKLKNIYGYDNTDSYLVNFRMYEMTQKLSPFQLNKQAKIIAWFFNNQLNSRKLFYNHIQNCLAVVWIVDNNTIDDQTQSVYLFKSTVFHKKLEQTIVLMLVKTQEYNSDEQKDSKIKYVVNKFQLFKLSQQKRLWKVSLYQNLTDQIVRQNFDWLFMTLKQ